MKRNSILLSGMFTNKFYVVLVSNIRKLFIGIKENMSTS